MDKPVDKKPIIIAVISASKSRPGGHWVQAKEIINGLRKEKNILAFHFPIDPTFPNLLRWIRNVPYLRTMVNTCLYVGLLLLKIGKYDILHIFSASYSSFLLAPAPVILIGSLLKKRVILNYHSGEAEDHLKRSFRVIKQVLKKIDVLVVPSFYLKKIFEQYGFRAEVIFNVVDLDTFVFKKRETFKPRFLVNRSLEPMYNVGCVLKAFRIIQDSNPEAELIVIGNGSEERRLRRLSKELELRNVIFTGGIEHEKMPDYLNKADFLLNASNVDNMPISILEAFSCGLPVISTKAGGIPYIIEDNRSGFLVDINDHEAMAEKAMFLVNNQEVAIRLAHTARGDCEELYSWKANGEKWLRLYNVCRKNL